MSDTERKAATDEVWARDEVESPCVKICVIHPEARICTGCLRSIDEITRWSKMSADERRAIIARASELRAEARLLRRKHEHPGISLTGTDAQEWLEQAGMITNKNGIPNDPRPPRVTSGLRLGTPALTTRGLKEDQMKSVAGWIDQVRFFPASGGPAILEQPRSRLAEPGESVTLNVDVRSLGTPAFQWYRGTTGDGRNPVDGATGSSFTAPPGDTDSRYWVRVTDEFGTADSGTAELLLVGGGIPSRFPRAYTVGEGWFYTAWFGLFQADEFPWIFHDSHGWLFVGNETGTARWFYDRALGWLYTAEDLYPFLYSLNYGDWIFYQRESREPRFFFVYSLDGWIEVE